MFFKKLNRYGRKMKMSIYKKGICIIVLTIFSFLFCSSLYSEEKKGGLGEWKPFGFLGKMGEWNPLGEGDIKKFIHAYAKYSLWDFKVYYNARDYERKRPYYSWAKGNFENRYPSFNFTYNMDHEYFYRRNLRIKDAYFYVSYTPRHKWKGNSYYYLGPYEAEAITVRGWVQWLIKRNKPFYITTGWSYSRTEQDMDPGDIDFSGSVDWYYDAPTWIYKPGVAPTRAMPWHTTYLGGYTSTSWNVYLGLGYHGKQY